MFYIQQTVILALKHLKIKWNCRLNRQRALQSASTSFTFQAFLLYIDDSILRRTASEDNNPSFPASLQPVNYSNPVYAKIYIDGQNCRKPVISIDERRELLPKKLEGTIHETAA